MRRSIHWNCMPMDSFFLLGAECRWIWPEAHACVPWGPMAVRQLSFAIVSLHHICTWRADLPSAVECMYVPTSDKTTFLPHFFIVQKTDMFMAGFVIILYDSAALQIKRFYLVLFWRARSAVCKITEDFWERMLPCVVQLPRVCSTTRYLSGIVVFSLYSLPH
jgi:hypothetical protein